MTGGHKRPFSRALVGVGVAIVIAIAATGCGESADTSSKTTAATTGTPIAEPAASPSTTSTFRPTAEPSSTAAPMFGPTGQTTEAKVVRIVDGDTIVVAYGGREYKVRYIGMDTPETVDPNSPVAWMGPQATIANAALVEGKTVILEKDVSEVDRFGRLLRYVWLTDGTTWTLVNLELVRQGVASAISYPPDVKNDDLYVAAEADAQRAVLGLWGPTPPPSTAAPTLLSTPKPIAKAPPTPKPEPKSKCHPSYDPCLPIVADLDCKDIRAMGLDPVTVKGPDKYRLDSDGDGLGCE